MKYKNTFCLLIALVLFSFKMSAQDGTNDLTFNSTDGGYSNGTDSAIASAVLQPDGKIILGGIFAHYGTQSKNGIVRINADESLDESFNVGSGLDADGHLEIVALQPDGKVLIGGSFASFNGTARNNIARLNADGSLDTSFNPGSGTDALVYKIVVQPDGKILVGGDFTTFNGESYNRIVRINTDGSTDNTFNIGTGSSGSVRDIALQPDGKIIVVGGISTFNGIPVARVVRLNTNGSVDTTFSSNITGGTMFSVALQADGKILIGGAYSPANPPFTNETPDLRRLNSNGTMDMAFSYQGNVFVLEIIVQPDGKILAGGTTLVRYNQDGTVDETFQQPTMVNGNVFSVALQPDNKIIAAGSFLIYNDVTENYITRLNNDGTKDTSFNFSAGTGADNTIVSILKQADNKLIITGEFNSYNGVIRNGIARITQDGLLDTTYDVGSGTNLPINYSAIAPDGKVIIVGNFTTYNGIAVNRFARINTDGSLDTSFNAGVFADYFGYTSSRISAIAVQPDGKVLLGGGFHSYDGVPVIQFCRLNTDGSLDTGFNPDFIPYDINRKTRKIVVLPDSKILLSSADLGTDFQETLFKINPDGTQDLSFTPLNSNNLRDVHEIAVQEDGKIIVAGDRWVSSGNFDSRFMRLMPDGSVDTIFQDSDYETTFFSVGNVFPQADGKIIVAGGLSSYNNIPVSNFIRINNDGSLDETFTAGLESFRYVYDIDAQQDKLIIAGTFTSYDGVGRNRIARLHSTGALSTENANITPQNNLLLYRENNALTVKSSQKTIASVEVYDLQGRLLANQPKINALATTVKDLTYVPAILIVKVNYSDSTVETKKIYY